MRRLFFDFEDVLESGEVFAERTFDALLDTPEAFLDAPDAFLDAPDSFFDALVSLVLVLGFSSAKGFTIIEY